MVKDDFDLKEWEKGRRLLLEEIKIPKDANLDRLAYLKYVHKSIIAIKLLMEEWYNNTTINAFQTLDIEIIKDITSTLEDIAEQLISYEFRTPNKANMIKVNVETVKRWNTIENSGIKDVGIG